MHIDYPRDTQIPGLRKLWQEAFGDTDAFIDHFFKTAYSPWCCRCVTLDGKVAAALYWFYCYVGEDRYAYLYAVATAKEFQGQGLCRELMQNVHKLLAEEGFAGAILVPADDGLRKMYAKMGYLPLSGMDSISCEAGGTPVKLEQLSSDAYAVARRAYLGPEGVGQEGVGLKFLSGMAQFYQGEDFLLAAYTEGDALQGVELLGNKDSAPGILAALGVVRGSFRVPGETPFAMVYPLRPATKPDYFGLAFD